MKILYISQYFPPDIGAGASRAYEMVRYLSEKGHRITVLTQIPNYPTGKIPQHYRRKIYLNEKKGDIDVLRVWAYPTNHNYFLTRMLTYISFMTNAFIAGLTLKKRDIIYATSPTPLTSITAYLISRLKGGIFIFEVRDLWPEVAFLVGQLNNRFLRKMALWWESFTYHKAHRIVTVTQGMSRELKERGISNSKISTIENGVNIDLFKPVQNNSLREKYGLDGKFVIVFSGIIGLISSVDTILETADILKSNENILFLFLGDGIKKKDLSLKIREQGLKNVVFKNPIPENELCGLLNCCNVGVEVLRKDRRWNWRIPVKIFNYMGCELPVILGGHGETERIFRESNGGILVNPENPSQLSDAILKLYSNSELCKQLGRNGRDYVVQHYSRRKKAEMLEKMLQYMVKS